MSVDFKISKSIFLQISDNICNQILEGTLKSGERVPSIRDLAADFEVNSNTVLRAYTILSDVGVIENKRGIGFFVTEDAKQNILERNKAEFFKTDLPEFINKIQLLKLNKADLKDLSDIVESLN
ncbi:MAG: GntR family transcriptional regulator [Prevotellaceae bacterium]|jgi:DNA-binding transcriptional regulator YhcF (GntR family)|nr:GntR family transcriptional regulator [Prevotellaceae bacterium]